MDKLAVMYWSQTGNTQAMAQAVLEGAQVAGAQAELFSVSDLTPEQANEYPKLALGCPAMGDEVLEEGEFQPFYDQLSLSGKKVALFGSYGWGDGQWMRDWQDSLTAAGGQLCQGEGLILNETPDEEGLASCKALGEALARF